LALVMFEVLCSWLVDRYGGFFDVVRTQLPVRESKGVLVRNALCVQLAQNRVEDDVWCNG
jgi:hypothetical protein